LVELVADATANTGFFTRTDSDGTDDVWFYDVRADGCPRRCAGIDWSLRPRSCAGTAAWWLRSGPTRTAPVAHRSTRRSPR